MPQFLLKGSELRVTILTVLVFVSEPRTNYSELFLEAFHFSFNE
jgi:hypothetical protein